MTATDALHEQRWRRPTILEIARASGVGTATVDRVLNQRGGVREPTRQRVLAALARLDGGTPAVPSAARRAATPSAARRKVAFLVDSGATFSRSLAAAVEEYGAAHVDVVCTFKAIATADVMPIRFAQLIERAASEADGLVIVAREDLTINRVIRAVMARRVPVVCLTTDLPGSHRLAYVGNDQTSAGATAAYLMGRLVGERAGKILFVISAPYRCQEERELGFRRVLRSEFTHLDIEERINSNDDLEYAYESVCKYIEEHGPPVGIYNVAGGNLGIARALQERQLQGSVAYIGHELNTNSRMLLEAGDMDFVVGHDLAHEVALSIAAIDAFLEERPFSPSTLTEVRVYTKYNCSW